jgi:hypothetical protein
MNTKRITSLIAILILGLIWNTAHGADCIDFRNLIGTSWPGGTGYNNDSLYPAGSTILSAGDVKIVKTHPYGNWNPPLVTSFAFGSDTSIIGDGYMTIDVASSTYPCKQLNFSTIASTLIINGDTINNFGANSSYTGSGYNIIVTNTFYLDVVVTGSFNSVILAGPNLTIANVCLEDCSVASSCIDFRNLIGTSWPGGTGYNNDSLYPAGSTILSAGDVKIVKTHPYGNWNPPLVTSFAFGNDSSITGDGYMTIDVASSTYPCKQLSFSTIASTLIINGDTITNFGASSSYSGSGYNIVVSNMNVVVTGSFNTVILGGPNLTIGDVCLEDCSATMGCTDFNNMTAPVADYNNDSIYSIGSTLLNSGDINLIKTKTSAWGPNNFEQTTILSISPTEINFHGYLTFDVSSAPYLCKDLVFKSLADKIIIGNDTINSITFGIFPPYVGNGYTLDTLGGGSIRVKGNFNAISIWAPTGTLNDVCLDSCSSSMNGCLIADDLDSSKVNLSTGGYNDDNTYPAGSVLASQNNINIIKTFGYTTSPNTHLGGLWNGQLSFWGGLTFDMSASTYSCKKLTLRISGGGVTAIYADNDTLLTRNGYTVNQIAFDHYEIQGTFNTVTFIDQSTSMFASACLEDCSINTSSCIDFQDTTLFLTIPTSQNNYGSPWYLNNGVSFSSKYYDYTFFNNPGEVVIGDHIVSGYTGSNGSSNYVGNIFHQGNTITQIDFSALALNPKQIEFDVNYILNNSSVNPYYINGQPLTNLPVGVTFIAAPLTNGYHITITGNVNTIEVHGFEVGIDNMCVDSVSTLPCIVNAMFTYTASQSVVAFTNGSSVTAANADQFIWNFGDGNTSSGDNDPIHTYGAPGSYWVCLTVVDFTCSNNPTAMYCDSVIIGNCQNGQSIITPNDDGLSDNVDLVAGSRIYDRNGFLVKKVTSNLKWAGKNDNNEDLPMGLYTVICPDNGVLKVTIVK